MGRQTRIYLWLVLTDVLASLALASPSGATNAANLPDAICLSNSQFHLQFRPGTAALTSLRRAGDADAVEFLRHDSSLGEVQIRYRLEGGRWIEPRVVPLRWDNGQLSRHGAGWIEETAACEDTDGDPIYTRHLLITKRWELRADVLTWSFRLKNVGLRPLELGDLALPLAMNTDYVKDTAQTFRQRVFKHAFIAGDGSFLYWLPVKGTGSFLVMMPQAGTGLEFFTARGMDYASGGEQYAVFIHSAATAEMDKRGTWRQPQTSIVLRPGEEVTNSFAFRWADSYAGVRDLLYQHGGLDIYVAPGMVVPRDLSAMFAVRTKNRIESIEPEFPNQTSLEYIGERGKNTQVYRVRFSRLGENRLNIRYSGARAMPLEFFVTLPLENLIKKRAAFIAAKQQHLDPCKWYDGLYSLWDRRLPEGQNLLGPDHLGGEETYAVSGSDDPCDSKCILLAEKNVAYPDAGEIESLEYFIKNFVWGKLQRTDKEQPYPYGIYGSDSWEENRFSKRDPMELCVSRPGGPSACHMWRTYDYTTYFALYFDMYRIARQRADLVHYLDAEGYLERAYGTARAFFEVPQHIHMEGGWAFTGWVDWQYTDGNFHEKYLLPLIDALEAAGQQAKADYLRHEWERKVKYFIYDDPWPFASEMPIDSTAYESTYAAAKYALTHGLTADTNLWFDKNRGKWFSHPKINPTAHTAFLLRQHMANLACRGVLEMNYWSLGSDFRGCGSASYTLSYMSQMGGWAVLDYALRFDANPAENLRLGYAAMLSSWALMNAGDQKSNYGFWTPGSLHDGAMSWGFQPRKAGSEWNRAMKDLPRGAWPVCGEADHGLVAGIEAACTVLFDDPIFGLLAYGGDFTQTGSTFRVIPRDGVRQRFSAVLGNRRLHLALERDGFAANEPIEITKDLKTVAFKLENRGTAAHSTQLRVEGLSHGPFSLTVNGESQPRVLVSSGASTVLSIPVSSDPATRVEFTPIGAN